MDNFELRIKRSVARDLRSIPKEDVAGILKRIDVLRTTPIPPGAEKLSGQNRYRLRQGVYRILYEIKDAELVIMVVKIGHRSTVYRAG